MLMRRYEVEYRLTRADPVHSLFKDELGEIREGVRRDRRRRDHEAAAQRPGEGLHRGVRQVDREHRQDFARGIAVISAETRQMLPAADEIIASAGQARRAGRRRRRGVAGANQDADHRDRRRGGADRTAAQLADRPQHHRAAGDGSPARWSGSRPAIPRVRHPGDRSQGRDRRHGAHRDRVPRQCAGARAAGGDAGRSRCASASGAAETIAANDRALREHGRSGARARCAAAARTAGDRFRRAQQRGRCGLGAGRAPPRSASARPRATSRRRQARPRNSRPRSARSPARPTTSTEVAERAVAEGAAHRRRPCRSSATPPPASAR